MRHIIIILFACSAINTSIGQSDSVIILKEVILSDSKLLEFSDGIKINQIKDSVLDQSSGMLTDNLQFNSPIYFKQNGYGMISSVSFRGTSAQQTAVVWNGININSQLTGQTDFNTVMAQNMEEVKIRSGGGSTQYGTGAIGGSIHLNQHLNFNSSFVNELDFGFGSFETSRTFYKATYGSQKFSINLGLGYLGSKNDYKYLGTSKKNENGAFSNKNLDLALGWLFSSSNLFKFYHNTFNGDRDLSGTLTAPSNDNYQDLNTRSLLEWMHFGKQQVHRTKLAYISERYRFFNNKESDQFSFGRSGSLLFNYDYLFRFKNWKVNGIFEANQVSAKGSSINAVARDRLSAIMLLVHTPSKKFSYGFNVRKDWVSDYDSPFVVALHLETQLLKGYRIRLNASKNYRIPTFNDLYWKGLKVDDNMKLVPETALQAELGQSFLAKNFSVDVTGFYIATKDLIQWRPDSSGTWSPNNVNDVTQYGLELDLEFHKKIGKHRFNFKNGYAYTKATDNLMQKQLIYVPYHKYNSTFSYTVNKWGAYVQALYQGEIFTTTDNKQNLPDYLLFNAGITYRIDQKWGITTNVKLLVNNFTNTNYQNVAFRPMPNRNIHLNLNLKL